MAPQAALQSAHSVGRGLTRRDGMPLLGLPSLQFARTILKATAEAKKSPIPQASNFTPLAGGEGKNHWGREMSLGRQAVRRELYCWELCQQETPWPGRGGVGRGRGHSGPENLTDLPQGILRAKQMAGAGRSRHFPKVGVVEIGKGREEKSWKAGSGSERREGT